MNEIAHKLIDVGGIDPHINDGFALLQVISQLLPASGCHHNVDQMEGSEVGALRNLLEDVWHEILIYQLILRGVELQLLLRFLNLFTAFLRLNVVPDCGPIILSLKLSLPHKSLIPKQLVRSASVRVNLNGSKYLVLFDDRRRQVQIILRDRVNRKPHFIIFEHSKKSIHILVLKHLIVAKLLLSVFPSHISQLFAPNPPWSFQIFLLVKFDIVLIGLISSLAKGLLKLIY